jgi:hypothetical protein
VVLPHMGLTDPRAYMRLPAIVPQQIIDGKTTARRTSTFDHLPQPGALTCTAYLQ